MTALPNAIPSPDPHRPCRNELLQLILEGVGLHDIRIEALLDRLTPYISHPNPIRGPR